MTHSSKPTGKPLGRSPSARPAENKAPNRIEHDGIGPSQPYSSQPYSSLIAQNSSVTTFPVLGAVGLILGIVLRSIGIDWPFVLVASVLMMALGLNSKNQRIRITILLSALLIPLGWARLAQVEATPDRFAGMDAQTMTLEGEYDGHFLETPQGRVLISPKDAITPGRWRVTGKLEAPRWYKNPGAFDLGSWLERRGVKHALHLRSSQALPSSDWHGWLEAVRAHGRTGAISGLPADEAAFMRALSLGETEGFSNLDDPAQGQSWRDVFSRSGLAHVLALSGQQVTLLVMALSLLLAPFGVRRFPALILFLAVYWLIVGPGPSVTRAVLQGVVVLVSLWLGRGRLEALPAIGLSVLVSLGFGPRWLFDLGWQLSYLAVLGMIVFTPPMTKALEKRPKWLVWLGGALAATLGAQAFTMPLAASSFGIVPPASPLSNLIVEPLMTLLVPLGFLAALAGPFGNIINLIVHPLAWLVLETAKQFSQLPVIEWGHISSTGMLAYLAGNTAFGLAAHKRLKVSSALLIGLAAIIATTALGSRQHAEIIYLDVGQGDSSLIRLPAGDILVDGGGTVRSDYDLGRKVLVPALRNIGVKSLRAVIATHADTDHIEGLNAVLERIPVDVLIVGDDKTPGSDPVWDQLKATARANQVQIQTVRRGATWKLGQANLRFHGPTFKMHPEDNSNSVAFTLEYHGKHALFLGDTPGEIEQEIHPGAIDTLKIAHHGSRFSTSENLLDATHPTAAIISSGASNTYGHPSQTVLERLTAHRIRVYRTDRDGAITYNLETGLIQTEAQNPHTGRPGTPGRRPGWKPQLKTDSSSATRK
jgi:competence protein ComEC